MKDLLALMIAALRASLGRLAPFSLKYVEVGNEVGLIPLLERRCFTSRSCRTFLRNHRTLSFQWHELTIRNRFIRYPYRWDAFVTALRAKFPQLGNMFILLFYHSALSTLLQSVFISTSYLNKSALLSAPVSYDIHLYQTPGT